MAPYLAEWPWSPLPMLPAIGAIMLRGTLDTVVDIKEDWIGAAMVDSFDLTKK
ncbi:hypothetical protein FOXB_05819 [Fusarium oxysporum f. sp. conglutinans Fo5176]|uniref:Uncharacterized protein n=1 Tax=Fusarium oxysporum (strain Fo5176) TaxID=660025 RepID=F9FHE0_FUSOF|nr:hypothetical protein FOXB_05819 [Fusarium oxysporum f. sp. conglutinans Fo5176]